MTSLLSAFTVTTVIRGVFFLPLCQATDGELIGAEECSCADYRTVKVLNQKVSLLLIIHNGTNSHVRLSPFFSQPAINILAVVPKKKRNNLHTIITVGRADCLQMFVLIIMGAEAGLP